MWPQPPSIEVEAEELLPLEVEAAKEQRERVVEAVVGDCHPLLAQRLYAVAWQWLLYDYDSIHYVHFADVVHA